MAVDNFIPKIWSARILEYLQKNLVYAQLFNRDYEGEISAYGDTVKIFQVGRSTVKDYTRNKDIDPPDRLETSEQLLVIDQQKYISIGIDDVDAVQARADVLNRYASNIGYDFGDYRDQWLAGLLATNAGIDLGTAAITATNAYDFLVDFAVQLDKVNVPRAGRTVVMPPEYAGFALKDPRLASGMSAGTEASMRSGVISRVAGLDIMVSNNVPVDAGKYSVIATTDMQGTFAEQIAKVEAMRPEKRFEDALKTLHVYGAKVLRPEIVAKVAVTF
jgi:P22 coat protein - gene protein 5